MTVNKVKSERKQCSMLKIIIKNILSGHYWGIMWKMIGVKPVLEIKHGHGRLSKLGRNQCEAVAYKNWFRSGKWHNPWMSVTSANRHDDPRWRLWNSEKTLGTGDKFSCHRSCSPFWIRLGFANTCSKHRETVESTPSSVWQKDF